MWFTPVTSVSSTNKTDRHDITEILLKVALNTIAPPPAMDVNYTLISLCEESWTDDRFKYSKVDQFRILDSNNR
jgi:hypothetical protein